MHKQYVRTHKENYKFGTLASLSTQSTHLFMYGSSIDGICIWRHFVSLSAADCSRRFAAQLTLRAPYGDGRVVTARSQHKENGALRSNAKGNNVQTKQPRKEDLAVPLPNGPAAVYHNPCALLLQCRPIDNNKQFSLTSCSSYAVHNIVVQAHPS
jgi:hypothetical protein